MCALIVLGRYSHCTSKEWTSKEKPRSQRNSAHMLSLASLYRLRRKSISCLGTWGNGPPITLQTKLSFQTSTSPSFVKHSKLQCQTLQTRRSSLTSISKWRLFNFSPLISIRVKCVSSTIPTTYGTAKFTTWSIEESVKDNMWESEHAL